MTAQLTLRAALPRPVLRHRAVAADVALAVAGAALVAGCAQVSVTVPWTPVPYTLQTFGVLVVGGALGSWMGAASLLLYVVAGVAGLGVFSGGASGWAAATGASGGYLAGFVVSAWLLGLLAERGWVGELRSSIGAMLTSLCLTFGVGTVWLAHSLSVPASKALELGVYPFVPGEVVKLYAAGALLPWTIRGARRLRGER